MPAPLYLSGPCKVCGRKTTGRHFGVMSCRACAAFFRRAITAGRLETDCEVGTCVIYANGKYPCIRCRLRKCYDVGMDSSKFQHNRDLVSSSQASSVPLSLPNFLGRPSFLLCFEPDKASEFKTIVDVSHLLQHATTIFTTGSPPASIDTNGQNSLEKLTMLNQSMKVSPNVLVKLTKIGKQETLYIYNDSFMRATKWFTSFPEFNELRADIKLEILKHVWNPWARLDKMAETAEHQRKSLVKNDVLLCGTDVCLEWDQLDIDFSWTTNYTNDQMKNYFIDVEKSCRGGIADFMELAPTDVEITYLLLCHCLQYAGKRCQGEVLEATEKLLSTQSNNLHDYYVNKMKNPHYSTRLTKLMRVNQLMDGRLREWKQKAELARIFNVFSIDFSHPEMFETI